MMRELLKKKSVKALLLLLIIIIWGYNAISFLDVSNEEDIIEKRKRDFSIEIDSVSPDFNRIIKYTSDFKDPFIPSLRIKRVETEQPVTDREEKPEIIDLPKLQLNGIVEKTAIIQNESGKIYFVSVGDLVEEARVVKISQNEVILSYKSKTINLQIE